jgi:hypothetical protein
MAFLLTENEVPVGATVFLCPPGSDEPVTDEEGRERLAPLKCMISGSGRVRFYPVNQIHSIGEGAGLMATSIDRFYNGVRFTPEEVFTPGTAPAKTQFAVFVDGRRVGKRIHVVLKDDDGSFTWMDLLDRLVNGPPVPAEAVLVRTSDVGGVELKPNVVVGLLWRKGSSVPAAVP